MADLLPSTPDLSAAEEAEPRVIGVDSDAADDLLSALSSDTARRLLAALHEEPANPARLAERVETSLQNAQYHLANLEEADLVEVVDTAYSAKGREMNVYAPSDRPLVVYAGREEETTGLRTALTRLFGAVAALALSSVLVQTLFGRGVPLLPGLGGMGSAGGAAGTPTEVADGGKDAANATTTASPTPMAEATEAASPTPTAGAGTPTAAGTTTPTPPPEATATPAPSPTPAGVSPDAIGTSASPTGVLDAAVGLPPGLLFFLGGATVLLVGFAVWYYRTGRPAAGGA